MSTRDLEGGMDELKEEEVGDDMKRRRGTPAGFS